jgi:hypothetical protein
VAGERDEAHAAGISRCWRRLRIGRSIAGASWQCTGRGPRHRDRRRASDLGGTSRINLMQPAGGLEEQSTGSDSSAAADSQGTSGTRQANEERRLWRVEGVQRNALRGGHVPRATLVAAPLRLPWALAGAARWALQSTDLRYFALRLGGEDAVVRRRENRGCERWAGRREHLFRREARREPVAPVEDGDASPSATGRRFKEGLAVAVEMVRTESCVGCRAVSIHSSCMGLAATAHGIVGLLVSPTPQTLRLNLNRSRGFRIRLCRATLKPVLRGPWRRSF